jgi:hypothetical protein
MMKEALSLHVVNSQYLYKSEILAWFQGKSMLAVFVSAERDHLIVRVDWKDPGPTQRVLPSRYNARREETFRPMSHRRLHIM